MARSPGPREKDPKIVAQLSRAAYLILDLKRQGLPRNEIAARVIARYPAAAKQLTKFLEAAKPPGCPKAS